MWRQLGLPDVLPDASAPPVARTGALQGIDFVRNFLAERIAEAPGGRVQARDLSRSYTAWAADTGAPSMTERALAMCLDALGVKKSRANYVHYLGIRIKHLSEFEASLDGN